MIDGHTKVFEWVAEKLDFNIPAWSVASGAIITGHSIRKLLIKRRIQKQQVDSLWETHLYDFLHGKTTAMVGDRGKYPIYDLRAAQRSLIPAFKNVLDRNILNYKVNNVLLTTKPDADSNLFIFGGPEPSKASEMMLEQCKGPFTFALMEDPSPQKFSVGDLALSRAMREVHADLGRKGQSGGDWGIINQETNEVLVKPELRPGYGGSCARDGAILIRQASPYNGRRQGLALMGAREAGTMATACVLGNPDAAAHFSQSLRDAGVWNEPFQAVFDFRFKPYRFRYGIKLNHIEHYKINIFPLS